MSCIKDRLKELVGQVLEQDPTTSNPGQVVLEHVKNTGHNKAVEQYLMEEYLGGRSNKAYVGMTGNKGFDGEVVGVRITDAGKLDVDVRSLGNNKVYKYVDIDISTGAGKQGRLAAVKDLDMRALGGRRVGAVYFNAGGPMMEASKAANQYVSRMLIGSATRSGGFLAPHIKKWHTEAMKKSGLYKEGYNLVSTGFGNQELLEEIKAYVNITGDISRKTLARVTTASEQVMRRNNDILTINLPKLDKKIQAEVKDKGTREALDDIFGRSGFGNLFSDKVTLEKIEQGELVKDIIKGLKANDRQMDQAKKLVKYYLDGEVTDNTQNSGGDAKVDTLVALLVLDRGQNYKKLQWLINNKRDLYIELSNLAGQIKELNAVVNKGAVHPVYGKGANAVYNGYDGHGTVDVFDSSKEFKVVEEGDGHINKYLGEGSPWKVLREVEDGKTGILYRESGVSSIRGMGVNENRISNGIALDRAYVEDQILKNPDWMNENNVVSDQDNGYARYRMILKKDEFVKADGKQNVAHRLMRTYVHNKELIEVGTVRDLISDSMVLKGEGVILDNLEAALGRNKKVEAKDRQHIRPFLNTKMSYEDMKKKYPEIAAKYKEAENISNYGNFNKEITYVRRDMAGMLTGHKQHTVASDNFPRLQEWERIYKQLVQLVKLKLVVANPKKLGTDILSNAGILMTMDVGVDEVYKYSKEAIQYSDQMGRLEGELVQTKLKLAEAELKGEGIEKAKKDVDRVQMELEKHPYYDAMKYGFVQSMATSMLLQEFDTVSGLQNTIDRVVRKVMEDEKGDKTEVHKAVVWWMNAGFGANDILDAVTNISKLKGTSFNEELVAISDRLKDKKNREDTVGYVSEFIAAPNSEVIRQGSRIMQLGDAMGRWTLYRHLVEQKVRENKSMSAEELEVAKEDAAMVALDTFIDYRLNMPEKIRALSDYGVLMFPSFWIRAQKVIYNLAKYHPVNAGGGYMIADLFGMGGASILDANVGTKLIEGHLVHAGQDVLDASTFVLGL